LARPSPCASLPPRPILTVILALIVVGAISSAVSKGNRSGSSGASANNPSAAGSTPITASASTPPPSNMTAAQQQAVESAQNYLSMGKGFSRAGLIQQLSSSYGDGFTYAQAVTRAIAGGADGAPEVCRREPLGTARFWPSLAHNWPTFRPGVCIDERPR
jgi:hypothetical protein